MGRDRDSKFAQSAWTSRFIRFGAMLKLWLRSVVALNVWFLLTVMLFCRIKRPMRPLTADCFAIAGRAMDARHQSQAFGHTGPAVAAQRQAGLFADVGQQNHACSLSPTGWTRSQALAARTEAHNPAQAVHRGVVAVFFNEGKSRLLLCAKNTVAFRLENTPLGPFLIRLQFRMSLSSLRMRFSRRSRSFSRARSRSCASIPNALPQLHRGYF